MLHRNWPPRNGRYLKRVRWCPDSLQNNQRDASCCRGVDSIRLQRWVYHVPRYCRWKMKLQMRTKKIVFWGTINDALRWEQRTVTECFFLLLCFHLSACRVIDPMSHYATTELPITGEAETGYTIKPCNHVLAEPESMGQGRSPNKTMYLRGASHRKRGWKERRWGGVRTGSSDELQHEWS